MTGLVACVFAAQVNSKYKAGDYSGAVNASNQARLWSIISLIVGVVLISLDLLNVYFGTIHVRVSLNGANIVGRPGR
jgi:hypothetical protein